jgi:hypothetical protein
LGLESGLKKVGGSFLRGNPDKKASPALNRFEAFMAPERADDSHWQQPELQWT